ncbi:MAG TPA: hypothetical protein VGS23_07260, partial [Thermoplasmata archaeon]|nr:hypothetical protein [Thermoplasmata archaeon]
MSADQVGEGAWTSISIRHSTVEQLRRSSRAGEAYDEAIARLIRDAAGRKRVVVHLGPWQWFVACLGCDWNRTVRG